MERIKQLFTRVAHANSVSETTTVDHKDQSQWRAHTKRVFEITPFGSKTDPDTSMAIFQKLSHPQQQQLIIKTIHAFIQEERRRNYHFLGSHSHRYMNQEDLLSVSVQDGRYTFTQCDGQSLEHTVCIEVVSCPNSVLTTDNLIITAPSRNSTAIPITVAKWLRNTYNWDNSWELRCPEEQYEEQRIWWDRNAKTFPLLSLPAEMRDAIYLQAIGPVVLPEHHDKITLGVGLTHRNHRQGAQRDPDVHPPNMTILKISRQVRSEAIQVADRDATKRFRALQSPVSVVCDFMKYLDVSARSGFLRVIQLEMTAKRYFEFIGISPKPGTPLPLAAPGSRAVDMLMKFRALQKLDFRFIGPQHKSAVCPWAFSSATAIHSCQKIWIHWFFVMAWDSLHQLMVQKKVKIDLSGCVKTSTREYWQNIFNNSNRTNYTAMIEELKRQIKEEKREDGPIPCKCSTMCGMDPRIHVIQWSEDDMRAIYGLKEETERWYWDFDD